MPRIEDDRQIAKFECDGNCAHECPVCLEALHVDWDTFAPLEPMSGDDGGIGQDADMQSYCLSDEDSTDDDSSGPSPTDGSESESDGSDLGLLSDDDNGGGDVLPDGHPDAHWIPDDHGVVLPVCRECVLPTVESELAEQPAGVFCEPVDLDA